MKPLPLALLLALSLERAAVSANVASPRPQFPKAPPTKPHRPRSDPDEPEDSGPQRRRKKATYTDPSIEDLESGLRGLRDSLFGFGFQLRNFFHRNRHAVMFAGGVLGLMHGGAAAFTVLFVQSFGASGWPLMKSGLQRGAAAYELAKERAPNESDEYRSEVAPLRKQLLDLASHLAALRREGASEESQKVVIEKMKRVRREIEAVPPSRRAAPVLVAACDASVVRDVCLGIWSGVTVSLAAACSSAARTIGIGVSLGEAVSKLAALVYAKMEPYVRKIVSRLPAEAVMLTYLGPSIVGSATISLLGRSFGCWVAYRLQHLAAVLSVSLLSARMLLESIAPLVDEDDLKRRQRDAAASAAEAAAKDMAEAAYVATVHAESVGEAEAAKGFDTSRVESREARRRRQARQRRRMLASRELIKLNSAAADGPRPFQFLRSSASTRREALAWLLAVASLQSQRARGFKLPLYLKLPLLPVVITEALLQKLANQLTSDGFPSLTGDKAGANGRPRRNKRGPQQAGAGPPYTQWGRGPRA
jgi:hypothetical protein